MPLRSLPVAAALRRSSASTRPCPCAHLCCFSMHEQFVPPTSPPPPHAWVLPLEILPGGWVPGWAIGPGLDWEHPSRTFVRVPHIVRLSGRRVVEGESLFAVMAGLSGGNYLAVATFVAESDVPLTQTSGSVGMEEAVLVSSAVRETMSLLYGHPSFDGLI